MKCMIFSDVYIKILSAGVASIPLWIKIAVISIFNITVLNGSFTFLDLPILNRMRSEFGRVHWNKDCTVCTDYNRNSVTVRHLSSHNVATTTVSRRLPLFILTCNQRPGLKSRSVLFLQNSLDDFISPCPLAYAHWNFSGFPQSFFLWFISKES
jgi:hypothetical protein